MTLLRLMTDVYGSLIRSLSEMCNSTGLLQYYEANFTVKRECSKPFSRCFTHFSPKRNIRESPLHLLETPFIQTSAMPVFPGWYSACFLGRHLIENESIESGLGILGLSIVVINQDSIFCALMNERWKLLILRSIFLWYGNFINNAWKLSVNYIRYSSSIKSLCKCYKMRFLDLKITKKFHRVLNKEYPVNWRSISVTCSKPFIM